MILSHKPGLGFQIQNYFSDKNIDALRRKSEDRKYHQEKIRANV